MSDVYTALFNTEKPRNGTVTFHRDKDLSFNVCLHKIVQKVLTTVLIAGLFQIFFREDIVIRMLLLILHFPPLLRYPSLFLLLHRCQLRDSERETVGRRLPSLT